MFEDFISILITILALFISAFDLKSHRIPNISILLMASLLSISMNQLDLARTVITLILLWTVGLFTKVGMGDLKLLTIILIFQGQILLHSFTLILSLLIAALSILLHLFKNRSLKGEIALAPAILIPFTTFYLAF